MDLLLGAHTFVSGGLPKAIELTSKLNFTAIQIFTKNNNRWEAPAIPQNQIFEFKEKWKNSQIQEIISHDSYLINLCAKSNEILEKSRKAFLDELFRCEQLGIRYLNFHPGSHGGQGEDEGIKIIVESLNICHDKTQNFNVSSMIETTAGQGTALGYRFEQIQKIIELVDKPGRLTVCIDTAHIFAAGYDIRTKKNYSAVMKEFDSIIGREKLKCIHLNDSKKALGSRVDRHEHIGKGFIGQEGFRNIMQDKRLKSVPKILETPKGKEQEEDLINIEILKSFVKNRS